MEENNKIVIFQENDIRRVWYNEEWYFSIVDVIEVLTNSPNPRTYWSKLKAKILGESQLNPNWVQLKMLSSDGKNYKTDATNTEGMLRIVQSISSPKAEPFKQWLAKVGFERIQEIENPELGIERTRSYYKAKGYDDAWIEMRIKSTEVRGQLTDEWKGRGVKEGTEYSILTAEISKATFGMTPSEYKEHKELSKENLRDHMTNLELIFTMLGEEATKTQAINMDAKGFTENKKAAIDAGTSTGKALDTFEKELGVKVITSNNFKAQIEEAKKKQKELDSGKDE